MINSYHHVSLNGVLYRLDESAEGDHYVKNRQPLRIQTGAVVQGDSGKFQLRNDLLEWQITDWSGGEGAIKFQEGEANRYLEGHNIDPLDENGKLKLARGYEETIVSGPTTMQKSLQLAKAFDGLYGASLDSASIFKWEEANEQWSVNIVNSEAGFAAGQYEQRGIAGDYDSLFLKENSVAAIWRYNGTSFVEFTTGVPGIVPVPMVNLANFFYVPYLGNGSTVGLYEVSKSDTPPVTPELVLDLTDTGFQADHNFLAAGPNRVYLAQVSTDETVVWRIVPSTAASVGFGEEILRQNGLRVESIWNHMGVLFLAGRVGTVGASRKRVIMYLRGSEVGVLANVRDGVDSTGFVTGTEGQEFEKAYFVAKYGPGDNTHEWTLFVVNLISGALVGTTVINVGADTQPQTLVAHNGEVFFGNERSGTDARTYRVLNDGTHVNTNNVTAQLDSSIHDFGLVDEKILLSFRLSTEPLPANSSVQVLFQLDQDGTWRDAGTYSTNDGTGTTFAISTAAQVRTFRNLQIRLKLFNGGTVADTPVVLSISARATVALGLNLWRLRLDLADDTGPAGGESYSGTEKITNLENLNDGDTVVELLDGYKDRRPGQYTTHNVVLDDAQIDLAKPGEGSAFVILREVD